MGFFLVVLLKSPTGFPILYYCKMGMMSSLRMTGLEKVSYWTAEEVFNCVQILVHMCIDG